MLVLGIVTNFIALYVLIKKLVCYFETNTLKYAELVAVLVGNTMPVYVELTVAKCERIECVDVVLESARTDAKPTRKTLLIKQMIWALHRRSGCSAGKPP